MYINFKIDILTYYIRYTGVIKFIGIPEDVKQNETYENFRPKYKKFLFEENLPIVWKTV